MSNASLNEQLSHDPSMPDATYDAVERTATPRGERSSHDVEVAPEQLLMIALVRDSIRCIQKYRHARDFRGKRLFAQETEWILSNDRSWLYSFLRVCETLDLDPVSVRRSLGFASDSGAPRFQRVAPAAAANLQ